MNIHLIIKECIDEVLSEDYPSSWNKDEFNKIHSYTGKVKYAAQHLQRISSGTGRVVFVIDDTKALKMAKNDAGVAQNEVEVDWGAQDMYGDIIAKVYDFDEVGYRWVEMELAKKLSMSKFRELTGIKNINELHDYLRYSGNNHYSEPPKELIEKYDNNEFADRVKSFMLDFDKGYGDLGRLNSYGLVNRNGKESVVIVDYGLSNQVHKAHYR
jgi:hypothetical protein